MLLVSHAELVMSTKPIFPHVNRNASPRPKAKRTSRRNAGRDKPPMHRTGHAQAMFATLT